MDRCKLFLVFEDVLEDKLLFRGILGEAELNIPTLLEKNAAFDLLRLTL